MGKNAVELYLLELNICVSLMYYKNKLFDKNRKPFWGEPLVAGSPRSKYWQNPEYESFSAPLSADLRIGVSLTAVSDQRRCLWKLQAFLKKAWRKL